LQSASNVYLYSILNFLFGIFLKKIIIPVRRKQFLCFFIFVERLRVKIVKIVFLFFSFVCTNFQIQAAYALKNGGKKEKVEKFAKCGALLHEFVCSEKFKKIFENIIFNEDKCCQVLFNGDSAKYRNWLNVRVQWGVKKDSEGGEKNYTIRLKAALNKIKNKNCIYAERKWYVDHLVEKLPNVFYEKLHEKIFWYGKTNFDNGDSICLCGFIELLTMLLEPDFYFETYNEDFAVRCRIFVMVYSILLLMYSSEVKNDVDFVVSLKNLTLALKEQ
jgi:hypothetical protein